MPHTPAISVVLPVYNAARYVARAVTSILSQSEVDFEFLITDDGSTDRSLEILIELARKDKRITLVTGPNKGYVTALNEMASVARGEFIARMDADDEARRDRFALQLAALREDPQLVALGSAVELIDAEGLPLMELAKPLSHESIDAEHLSAPAGAAITHPAVMMRASALHLVGGYRPEFSPAEDADLFLRLAEVGQVRNLKEPLLKYRVHLSSVSNAHKLKQLEALYRAACSACERRGLAMPHRQYDANQYLPETALDMHIKFAWWALHGGHPITARRHAWKALCMSPFTQEAWRAAVCSLRGY